MATRDAGAAIRSAGARWHPDTGWRTCKPAVRCIPSGDAQARLCWRTLVLEFRSAAGTDRLPELAAELVRLPVDVIVVEGTPAARAAKQATSSIPIVMGTVAEPVETGLVTNLARPDGNITGFTGLSPELGTKRLGLLKEAFPNMERVGVLLNPRNPANALQLSLIHI